MPTPVNACDCLNAISDFARSVMDIQEATSEDIPNYKKMAHDALTKAEKLCGHVRAGSARELVQNLDEDWERSYEVAVWDLAANLAVLGLASELKSKGGCSDG